MSTSRAMPSRPRRRAAPAFPRVALLLAALLACAHAVPAQAPARRPDVLGAIARPGHALPGFVTTSNGEQVSSRTLSCGSRLWISAAPSADFDPMRPTRVIVYALPNGNTIEQTIGRAVGPGVDWHYGIQHIGAQARELRRIDTTHNVAVAYLEARGRSWPAWRRTHGADAAPRIAEMLELAAAPFAGFAPRVELGGHSGGGSLIFGFLNGVDDIPSTVTRIAFLDANYAYDAAAGHADKLARWLLRGGDRVLVVAAYDDRRVEIDGKRIVSEEGGTWGRTRAMARDLRARLPLHETTGTLAWEATGLGGRVDLRAHLNPENRILHTVLVERNGFLHAMLAGGPLADRNPGFFTDPVYTRWIAPSDE